MTLNLKSSTEEHITKVINKLRLVEQSNEYKTIVDTLDRLINLSNSMITMQPVFFRENDRLLTFYFFDENTYNFVLNLVNILEAQINKVKEKCDDMLVVGNYKDHRDWVISYDKLIRLYGKLDSNLQKHIKYIRFLENLDSTKTMIL